MSLPQGLLGLLLAASVAARAEDHPAPKGPAPAAAKPAAKGRLSDAQAAELAKEALAAESPASIRAVLDRLKGHTFKSSKVPEREFVLYVQGTLEARLGNLTAASVHLRKLEKQWPKSPFMGEAQAILAEDAVLSKRYKEAENRLHQALGSDMPSERKRKPQELLLWTLAEQGRLQEGLPIVQSLRPLEDNGKPTERGLVAMVEVLAAAKEKGLADGARQDFQKLYPKSEWSPRVELAWGRLLGETGDAKGSAQVLRKLIKDAPRSPQADDARLALANLLTDGSLPDSKDMPTPESLLAEVRKGAKGMPRGMAQLVELRLLVGKTLWDDALALADRMEPAFLGPNSEGFKLWQEAWRAWVDQRLEKGYPGELLMRLKAGAFAALKPAQRQGVVTLLAAKGLLDTLPALLAEAPAGERPALRRAALGQAQAEGQPQAVLAVLKKGPDTPEEAQKRAQAEAALGRWAQVRAALARVKPGEARLQLALRLLQRPMDKGETPAKRLAEAEGWLARATEKGAPREALAILVGDLRMQTGNPAGALAVYPVKATDPAQRGWVALMRAQALLKGGKTELARQALAEARDEQGFKGQRDAMAKALRAY